MTYSQRVKAAQLFSLAVIANGDGGGAKTEEEQAVIETAGTSARIKLRLMGYNPDKLLTLGDCVKAAQK